LNHSSQTCLPARQELKIKIQIHTIIQSYINIKSLLIAWLHECMIFKYRKIILILPIAFIFYSCKDQPRIPEEKFIRVYVDLLIIHDSSSVQNLSLDSLKQALFKKYETTEEHYQNTIDYYNETPQKWEAFFDKATAYVEELESKQAK